MKIVDKVSDELDDSVEEVTEAELRHINVIVSPAMSPKGEALNRGLTTDHS